MKVKDLTNDQAREYCKKANANCKTCKLKRIRIDNNGKEHIMFCAYELRKLGLSDELLENEVLRYFNND